MEKLLEQAIEVAVNAHRGQRDKVGMPYILHPLTVMGSVQGFEAKMVAVLHDTVEDTHVKIQDLARVFPAPVVAAVDAISKREGETNREYWSRVKANTLALRVKLADIAHNSSPERQECLEPDERAYLEKKYRKAVDFLTS
jgi:(p)ppGpp synthase/HD superfamily hydrolase